ncbi:MAG TPA: YidC/Oxa1 family membrane protein insertase [Acidimicrobiales bacterium]|nr:YidC/Oxa1 family membrane protein insertase [Acidimicrobiales bacterium]
MFDPFFKAFAWILEACYSVVPNYAFAIGGLTLVVYLAMFPITLKQTRSGLAMARLSPEVARLKKQHKGDPKALMEAQQELFAREGVNPAASCLPALLQMPVFMIMWQVIRGLTATGAAGVPAPRHLEHGSRLYRDIVEDGGRLMSFGVDLAKSALKGPHTSFAAALPFFVLAVLAAITSYVQIKRSQGRNPTSKDQQQQPAMQMQATMIKFIPIMSLMSGLVFPAGLALYMLVQNLFRIAQQEGMYRWDPHVVSHAKAAAESIERAAATDTTAKSKPKPEQKNPPRPAETRGTNGTSPAPAARETGRAQPKGTQGRRNKRKKSRR